MKFIKLWERFCNKSIGELHFLNVNGPLLFYTYEDDYFLPNKHEFIHPFKRAETPYLEIPFDVIYSSWIEDVDNCGISEIILSSRGAHKLYVYKWMRNRFKMIWEGFLSLSHIYKCGCFKLQGNQYHDLIAGCESGTVHIYLFNEGIWSLHQSFEINDFFKYGGPFDVIFIPPYQINSLERSLYYITRLSYISTQYREGLIDHACVLWEAKFNKETNQLMNIPIIEEAYTTSLRVEDQGFFNCYQLDYFNKGIPLFIVEKKRSFSIYKFQDDFYQFIKEFKIPGLDTLKKCIICTKIYDIDKCGKDELIILDSTRSLRIFDLDFNRNDDSLILKQKIRFEHAYDSFQLVDFDNCGRVEILLFHKPKGIITVYKLS